MPRSSPLAGVVALLFALLAGNAYAPQLHAQGEAELPLPEELTLPHERNQGLLPSVEMPRSHRNFEAPPPTKPANTATLDLWLHSVRSRIRYLPWRKMAVAGLGVGILCFAGLGLVTRLERPKKHLKRRRVRRRARASSAAESLHSLGSAVAAMQEMSRATEVTERAEAEHSPAQTYR